MTDPLAPIQKSAAYDVLAPDGSEIRLMSQIAGGSMVHCSLPPGSTSVAVSHRTVEEIWYFLAGAGQVWRKLEEQTVITEVQPGLSLTIPLGTHFQFRNTGDGPLEFVIVTMPPWPGEGEAFPVEGLWSAG